MLACWTDRHDGDQRTADGRLPSSIPRARQVLRLRQVHGDAVVVVDADPPPGTHRFAAGESGAADGDAVVAVGHVATLTVLTADCASIALGSPEGVHAAVHAGWRGLVAGVVDRAVVAMRALGASDLVAGLGPCIGPCCYEFSPSLAASVARRVGSDVVRVSSRGRPALDLPAAVRASLDAHGVRVLVDVARCTACSPDHFSHRGRRDHARQALFVWRVT